MIISLCHGGVALMLGTQGSDLSPPAQDTWDSPWLKCSLFWRESQNWNSAGGKGWRDGRMGMLWGERGSNRWKGQKVEPDLLWVGEILLDRLYRNSGTGQNTGIGSKRNGNSEKQQNKKQRHRKCLYSTGTDVKNQVKQVFTCDEEFWHSPILHAINNVNRNRKIKFINERTNYHNNATQATFILTLLNFWKLTTAT